MMNRPNIKVLEKLIKISYLQEIALRIIGTEITACIFFPLIEHLSKYTIKQIYRNSV